MSAEEERLSLALPAAASAIAALVQRPAVPADIVVDRLGRTEPCPICLVAPELDDALIEMGCPGGCGPFHAECLQNWLY